MSANENEISSVSVDGADRPPTKSVVTANEFLDLGISVWYTQGRKRTLRSKKSKIGRFKDYYGVSPLLCASMWEDLQRTNIAEANIDDGSKEHLNPKHFLMALNTLKRYPTDNEREGPWNINRDRGRNLVWYFLRKLQALKGEVIVWPEDWGTDKWIITVDGTHCWIQEPVHPDWSQDRTFYSHKYNKAGVNYELGVAIAYPRLVWMNGPFRAGKSDVKIFREKGLKERLQSIGKKAIGDRGYSGHPNECSTYNAHDCRGVRKFKSRALKRHETFNNMTKRFDCLSGRFRHGVDQFGTCFEAICVICQYQLEDDMPLFDVLIEDIMEEN
ncbi:DDE superfamily endonuclease [Nitzschia inconspicua]|uniref:DDE superfamily endonuclease n=1 Tax=Nitzschia inconspicua TaxID=303405 RepID=A0A9K3PEQ6_9STRA|nr:DDE superfamily endonuclease [Nitzschia inconspicua]